MKPDALPLLLVLLPMSEAARAAIASRYDMLYAPDSASRATAIAARGADVRAVLTNGAIGTTAAEIDAMPRLTLGPVNATGGHA